MALITSLITFNTQRIKIAQFTGPFTLSLFKLYYVIIKEITKKTYICYPSNFTLINIKILLKWLKMN